MMDSQDSGHDTGRELLDELAAQESRLVFDHFDEDTAWALGVSLREAALAAALPVAISIRRNGQRLFHAALPGSSADNDDWLARKSAVSTAMAAPHCAWENSFGSMAGPSTRTLDCTPRSTRLTVARSPSW